MDRPVFSFNAPNARTAGPFWPVFVTPKAFNSDTDLRASKPVTRALSGSRNGRFGTLSGASSGTENHPAPNDPKLGRLRCARQGLVRVPESNTKYGGNWGKPEGAEPSDLAQVSVSPERFPSENICFGAADLEFAPLFTGQLYFVPSGVFGGCSGKTHVRLRKLRAGMPAGAWSWAAIPGKLPPILRR